MDNISTAEWSLDVNTTINTAGHRAVDMAAGWQRRCQIVPQLLTLRDCAEHRAVDTAAGWQRRCQIVPQLLTLRDSADDVAVCCG